MAQSISLNGQHLIYTRVEAKFSRQGKSGFQIYYSSPGLADSEIQFIESRIACLGSGLDKNSFRLQYFQTKNQNHVLVRTTPSIYHASIIDQDRRAGVFLAHAVILSSKEFSRIENDPFIIFDSFEFAIDPESMVERFSNNVASTITLPMERGIGAWSKWQGQAILDFISLTLDATNSQSRNAIPITGTLENIQNALRALFWMLEPERRAKCTFDTFIGGCRHFAETYLFEGDIAGVENIIPSVDADNSKVYAKDPTKLDKRILYYFWMDEHLQKDAIKLFQWAPTVKILSHKFHQGEKVQAGASLDPDACNDLFSLQVRNFDSIINTCLVPYISQSVCNDVCEYIKAKENVINLFNVLIARTVLPSHLGEYILQWIMHENNPKSISDSDWMGIGKVGDKGNDPVLKFWATYFSKNRQNAKALSRMNNGQYRTSLFFLGNNIPDRFYVSPKHIDILIEKVTPRVHLLLTSGELLPFIVDFLKASNPLKLGFVTPVISEMDDDSFLELERLLRKKDLPKNFKDVLDKRSAKTHHPSFWERNVKIFISKNRS